VKNVDNSYTLTFQDGQVHQFNVAGKLVSLADRNNNAITLSYTNGVPTTITDAAGRTVTLTYDGYGAIESLSDSTGNIATYTHWFWGILSGVAYADGSQFNFATIFVGNNIVLGTVTDALGNVLESHTYDSQLRALTSEVAGNGTEKYTLNYVSATETDVTDALDHVTKYFYDASKGRNVVTRVEGLCSCGGGSQVQTWTYDNQLNVTARTDALSHTATFTYDAKGNRLTETDATGTVTYTYNQFGQVLTRTDQMNGVITNTYDTQGKLLTTKDALNNTTTLTYDSHGQPLTITDARGKITTFTWDSSGRLTQKKDALNNTTDAAYDARARLTAITNPLSQTTSYEYDLAGRPKKTIFPDSNFVSYTYDLAGRRTKTTDARGNDTNFTYDSAYRLTSVTDALSHATSYGYDAMSNQTAMTDALGRVTNYQYDDFNRLKKVIYPPATTGATRLQETIEYDAGGNVKKKTDTAGRDTTYLYDAVNRLTKLTDPALQATQFEYNTRSQTTGVLDASSQHYTFAYDAVGRTTGMTRASVSMSYAYDAVGSATQRTDYNGAVTNYTYDDLNRLTQISYPGSITATYAYDALSRMTSATNENGAVSLSYDNRGRVSGTTDVFGQTIGYSYDANGNRTAMTLNGAAYASYAYDAVNRLTNLADSANQSFSHSYDAANRLTSRSAPNGVTSTYGYDGLSRITALTHMAAPTTLIDNQYSYNDANNITGWTNPSGNHAYGFDLVDRLASATNSAEPNENYAYDGVGNRTASHLSASYSYQPFNKLTSTPAATYFYDNNGNLISRTDGSGSTTLGYDEENRLKQVLLPTGVTVNYKYDALGRRIQRTATTGANERYVYDSANVLLDLNADGSVATTYLNGPGIDNHLRQTNATTGVSYYLSDHLGSIAGMTDTSGSLVETDSYDSFGNSAGSGRTRYGYTGRERDPDTGLIYYRARFYDPQLGRFTSEDPIGLSGGMNLYTYVASNPISFTDPSGTQIRSDRNWNEGDKNPITGETLHNDFRQAAGMACALDGFNPWLSLEAGGGFHFLSPTGGNGAVGMKINPWTLEVCLYVRTCVRTGFGIYGGGGLTGAFNFGPSEGQRSRGWSTNLGGDVAVPGEAGRFNGRGSSGNLGWGGVGVGAGPVLGAGFSAGIDVCHMRLVCFNSPKCPCN
jgi:RHS repeat-associated protein